MNNLNVKRGNPIKVFTGTDFKQKKKIKTFKSKRQELKNNLKQQLWD